MAGLFPLPVVDPAAVLAGPAPRGLGRAMAGGGDKVKRRAHDFYPTPAPVTRALMRRELHCIRAKMGGAVWEPCGRGGAILSVLRESGLPVIGTDIVADPAHDVAGADLFSIRSAPGMAVVTNPPFALATECIVHLIGVLRVEYCAMLLKSTFWHAAERHSLWRDYRPARIYALGWRPDFMGLGAPTMECVWVVWQRGWGLPTSYDILPRDAVDARIPGL